MNQYVSKTIVFSFIFVLGLSMTARGTSPHIVFSRPYDDISESPMEGLEIFSRSWFRQVVLVENEADSPEDITLVLSAITNGVGGVTPIGITMTGDDAWILAEKSVTVPGNESLEVFLDAWLENAGFYPLMLNGEQAGYVHALALHARPFENWIRSQPIEYLPDEGQRGKWDMPADDGTPNLIKYALRIPPTEQISGGLVAPTFVEEDGDWYFAVPINVNPNALGVEIGVQFSDDLDWDDTESMFTTNAIATQSTGSQLFLDTVPVGDDGMRFARVIAREISLSFSDEAFEDLVREVLVIELDRPELADPSESITFSDAEAFTALFAVDQGISNLEGASQLWNTRFLNLSDNASISNLEPLADLAFLNTLRLANTDVNDITPLSSTETLQTLDLAGTEVFDLAPLSESYLLKTLDVSDTWVDDISALANLSGLQTLSLEGAPISDITALEEHSGLQQLYLGRTEVDNLDSLRDIPNLQRLDLTGNTALVAQTGNFFPLQALLAINAQQIFLEGTTGLNWNDYGETWLWTDQLIDQGRLVHTHFSDGPIASVSVRVNDVDPLNTAPSFFDVSVTHDTHQETKIFMIDQVEGFLEVPHETRITAHPGNGWRAVPSVDSPTPDSAYSIVGAYSRSLQLGDRPIGTVNIDLERADYFVEGILVDDEGAPIEGASVRITDIESGRDTVVNTDYYGHFHLDFEEAKPDEVVVAPEVQDFIFASEQTFNVRDFGQMTPLTLDDESRIVFVDDGDLHVIYPDGSGRQQIQSRQGNARLPNWSPDGNRILYNEGHALRRIHATGGNDTEIIGQSDFIPPATGSGQFWFFEGSSWASDDTVVFSSDVETTPMSVVMQNVLWETTTSGGQHDLEDVIGYDSPETDWFAQTFSHPEFSPDGDYILYTGGENGLPHWDSTDITSGVWLMDLSGDPERELLVENASHPSWSPDGEYYAYALDGELYIQPIGGFGPGASTRLAAMHNGIHRPRWSPDGNWIVYEYEGSLYIVSTIYEGHEPIHLTVGGDPDWSV